MPYIDNSKDIADLFEKRQPDFVAKNDHIAGILHKYLKLCSTNLFYDTNV